MASIDLNIVDRGIQGTVWTAQNTGIQASQLDKIKEQKTDNSGALNSLPTPFARFFVVKEAFRRITEEVRHPENKSGLAYTRIVSDCLDVFELLFYKKYHENQWGEDAKIIIKEWNKDEQMKELQDKVPILYNALKACYKEDINEPTLFFVILEKEGKEYLLATSSPMTGFVTPPDMDKYDTTQNNTPAIILQGEKYESLKIARKGHGYYFRDVVLFGDRDKDFKNYMYQLFGGDQLDEKFNVIRDYIRMFGTDSDIRNNYNIKLADIVTEYNSSLVINGLKIGFNDETDINNFFLPTLIRIPYKLNRDNFEGINYEREPNNRDYDYLIPLKSEALAYLDQGLATCQCQIKPYSVVVKFKYNEQEYSKTYELSNDVRNLAEDSHNLNIGLFPNILSSIPEENNYFKLALSVADLNKEWHTLSAKDVSLSFFKKNKSGVFTEIAEVDPERAQNGVLPAVTRSEQGSSLNAINCNTKYYELFNTSFDAIEITIGNDKGFMLPKWKMAQRTNDSYTYAIDLGTSNTFISRTKDNENNAPEMFSMREPMVSYMHEHDGNSQYSLVSNIEDAMFAEGRDMMKTEFVPPFIDGTDYKFPIRTAICKARNKADKPVLFDNHNIAFFYEKMMENNFQECLTDIKWEEDEDHIKLFVKELLLIIKCDILQRNGVLNQTSIVWFRPLSFSGNAKRIFDRTWKNLPKDILFTSSVTCYTESEAPYYYFKKMDIIKNTDSVTVIDIGGGSTDFVYFSENKPISASSVHFGCDVLWSNGHKEFDNVRENGIYAKYIDNLNWGDKENLRKLESEMKTNKKCSTTDIINFWLSNSKNNDIIDRLHDDYLPLFVYHFTAIIFYIAKLYKYKSYDAPRSIVFSGNGSRYVDNFITEDTNIIEEIVTNIFKNVYGEVNPIHVVMPTTRKESTCYGGLYRTRTAPEVPETIYHGVDKDYDNVGQMNADTSLKKQLMENYNALNKLYNSILDMLRRNGVIDNSVDLEVFKNEAAQGYEENLTTHYRSEIKEKYEKLGDEAVCNDAVFFIPVVDKIFELSKLA